MQHAAELRRCLETCDVAAIRRLWKHVSPHLPQPENDDAALISIHHARTQAQSMPLEQRAYSHRWLLDHGYPSALPDELRPRAERMYPKIVEGVGISVGSLSPVLKPVVVMVRASMENAVLDVYADDAHPDPAFVRTRIQEARASIAKTVREAIGDLTGRIDASPV